jgi:hypothetical protein
MIKTARDRIQPSAFTSGITKKRRVVFGLDVSVKQTSVCIVDDTGKSKPKALAPQSSFNCGELIAYPRNSQHAMSRLDGNIARKRGDQCHAALI